jgi:hypothetical protein
MSAQTEETKKDYFWLYVAGFTIALVGAVAMAKLSENEKYDPIKQQLDEESGKMNIRVIKEY